MSSKYDISQGTLLEGFEEVSDWVVSNGSLVNDTSFVKEGSKSLKLTSASGTNCIATKTINLDLSSVGCIYFWLYIPSLAEIASIQVILSNDANFSNFFSKSVLSSLLHEGWNKIMIGKDQWVASGSPVWTSNIVRLRVRVNANASVTSVVYYDSMFYGFRSRAKAIISFDDGWDSVYTKAFPYMRRYQMKGALYLIIDRIGTSGYMTKVMVDELFQAGWDVMNHTKTHVDMATLTKSQQETEYRECAEWIKANGWSRRGSELHLAFPFGSYNQDSLNVLQNLGFLSGRTVINRTQANELDNKLLLARQSHAYTASQEVYRAYIDRTITDNGSVQINYHKIEDSGSDADTEVDLAQFQDLIDYLYSKRQQIDTVTFTEWYRGITEPRKLIQ